MAYDNVVSALGKIYHFHCDNIKSSTTVFLGYLRFPLILVINFYYAINKLIILVPDPPLKVPLNRYLYLFNH
jgi:hypothetical protein